MTCTDGGEDNSPVHDTYHDFDQVTLGADLLVFGRESLRNKIFCLGVFVYLASGLIRMHTREPTALLCAT